MLKSIFRPCIDLHNGEVKQIVGGTLSETETELKTNFVSKHKSDYFAKLYQENNLTGGHLIKLGPNNDEAALLAIKTWPNGIQVGGGITIDNAAYWIKEGASKVIVTSWVFPDGKISLERLKSLSDLVGVDRLVLDLSCRRKNNTWFVATNKWQTITDFEISKANLIHLSKFCCEFLVHAADVEGLCQGIDEDLVKCLGEWTPIPCTYAGGAKHVSDLKLVNSLSNGKVDLTYGSALDIFGGSLVTFDECVQWNNI